MYPADVHKEDTRLRGFYESTPPLEDIGRSSSERSARGGKEKPPALAGHLSKDGIPASFNRRAGSLDSSAV
jgi:hypothetical protein